MNQINWKQPAVPRTVVQAIVIDNNEKALLIHRSPTVRSAANVWSVPSGLQEIGESISETIDRELVEEFSLKAIRIIPRGIYENIAGDPNATEQYHWVIVVVVVVVEDVNALINNEPDKHDVTEIVPISWFRNKSLIREKHFHKSLETFLINDVYNQSSLESMLDN
jgi:ADP-ribose pyrophosphatase YjhB (NUDIX family)